jgi:hypothetical protein
MYIDYHPLKYNLSTGTTIIREEKRAIAEDMLDIYKAPVLFDAAPHVAGMACQPHNARHGLHGSG